MTSLAIQQEEILLSFAILTSISFIEHIRE